MCSCPIAFSALRDKIGWRHTMVVIGALQSTIIVCGTLLRPIIIKPNVTQETESATKELEVLHPQTDEEQSVKSKTSFEPNQSYIQENELTGDSGIQSLKDTDNISPEERTLLQKGVDTENKCMQNSEEKVMDSEIKDKDAKDRSEAGKW